MTKEITTLLQEQASGPLLEKVAALLGENTDVVQNGLILGFKELLASVEQKLSGDAGNDLFNSFGDGSKLDKLQNHLAGGNQTVHFLGTGSDKARELLGDQADSIFESIASESGLRKESIPFLMGVAQPILYGVLGKQKQAGLDLNGMKNSLSSLTVQDSITSLETASNDQPNSKQNNTTHPTDDLKSQIAAAAFAKAQTITVPTGESVLKIDVGDVMRTGKPKRSKFWPIFILFVLASVLFFRESILDFANGIKDGYMSSSDNTSEIINKTPTLSNDLKQPVKETSNALADTANSINLPTDKTGSDEPGSAETAIADPENTISTQGEKIGDKIRFTLPGGTIIDVPENSFEAEMLAGLANSNGSVFDQIYILDRIYFASGSAVLSDDSRIQITGMATILNAYPDLKISLRGHTDSQGSANKNLELSKQRARAVKAALTRLAVESERVSTKGMGSLEPLATNKTATGRAKNRRIDMSLSK